MTVMYMLLAMMSPPHLDCHETRLSRLVDGCGITITVPHGETLLRPGRGVQVS